MAINIKELSEQNDIGFESLLAGIAREEVLAYLSESVFGKYLWLCAPENIGIESYKQYPDRVLTFAYCKENDNIKDGMPGSKLNDRVKGAIMLSLTGRKYDGNEKIQGKVGHDGSIYLDVFVDGKMRVPIRLDIFPVLNGIYTPIRREAKLIRSEKVFSYLRYPSESELAKGLYKIIKNLELINDMSIYHRVFDDIMTKSIEGKLVWSELFEYIKADSQDYDKDYLKRIISYKENANMRDKWNKYAKRQELESLDWKKVINAIMVFITPIWECVCEDRPFIGDWMPEIGRFL